MSAVSIQKPAIKMVGATTSIGGVEVTILKHPGKGTIPVSVWERAVDSVVAKKKPRKQR